MLCARPCVKRDVMRHRRSEYRHAWTFAEGRPHHCRREISECPVVLVLVSRQLHIANGHWGIADTNNQDAWGLRSLSVLGKLQFD